MNAYKIYFGLPRLNVSLLAAQCKQLSGARNMSVKNLFYFWPADTVDVRESFLQLTDPGLFVDEFKNYRFGDVFINCSDRMVAYKAEIGSWLNILPSDIKLPEENSMRAGKYKINLFNVFSQAVARSAVAREILSDPSKRSHDVFVLTRPDLVLSSDLNFEFICNDLVNNPASVYVPCSGHHYGGVCDQFMIFSGAFLKELVNFPEYLWQCLSLGEELKFELILKRFIEGRGGFIKSFDRIAYIFRDGRFVHSGDDGIVVPDMVVPPDFSQLTADVTRSA